MTDKKVLNLWVLEMKNHWSGRWDPLQDDYDRTLDAYVVRLWDHEPRYGDNYRATQLTSDDWKMVQAWKRRPINGENVPIASWEKQRWWRKEVTENHFPYVAHADPSKIAFTEDDAKGRADRQTVIKPGKFLKKFFGDVLSDAEISELANQYIAKSQPGTLKIARDADEIEHVYENGPSSCMGKPVSYFDSSIHPARVYASEDLGVAYIDRGGDIVARAVVWPERKTYVRIYGDEHRLQTALEAEGYTKGDLEGARLLLIEDGGQFVCPYLDSVGYVQVKSDHLLITRRGEVGACETDGLIGSACTCDRCEARVDEDDRYYIEDVGEYWCQDCESEHAVYVERYGYTVSIDNAVLLENGDWVSRSTFRHEGYTCEGSGGKYLEEDDPSVTLADGTMWCRSYYEDNGFDCPINEEYYRVEDGVEHPDHGLIHKDTEEAKMLALEEAGQDTLDLEAA